MPATVYNQVRTLANSNLRRRPYAGALERPYLLPGEPVGTGVRSWLCMTVMSQPAPEDVKTKSRRPVRNGIGNAVRRKCARHFPANVDNRNVGFQKADLLTSAVWWLCMNIF